MADSEKQLRNQRLINEARERGLELSSQELDTYDKIAQLQQEGVITAAELTQEARSLDTVLKDQLGIVEKRNLGEKALLGISSKINSQAQENLALLDSKEKAQKAVADRVKTISDASREVLIAEASLTGDAEEKVRLANDLFGTKQRLNAALAEEKAAQEALDALFDEEIAAQQEINRLKLAGKALDDPAILAQQQIIDQAKVRQSLGAQELADKQKAIGSLDAELSAQLKIADAETQQLFVAKELESQAVKNNEEAQKQLAIQEKVQDSLGVAGNLIKGLSKSLGGFADAFKFDKVNKAMSDFAQGEKGTATRLQVLGVGIKSAAKNLATTLGDPTVVFGALLKSYGEFEKANREVRKTTGQTATNFSSMNTSMASATDQVKAIGSLSKEIGINVNSAFGTDTIIAAAEMSEFLGVGAKATANMALRAEALGQDMSKTADTVFATTSSFIKQGGAAVNVNAVMEDVGNASNSLALSLGGSTEELTKAAAGAASLGINLAEAEGIADNLLNFEQSIQDELEAELLTGKEINLEKAREAALNNDMATLTKEIADNTAIQEAFSSGNRIQQESIAKSLGMSKEQVSKMILLSEKNKNLTEEQRAAAAGITVEEARRLSAQESIQKSIEKLTAAFAPLLDIVARLISSKVGMLAIAGIIGTIASVQMITGAVKLTKSIGGLGESFKSLKDTAKASWKSVGGFFSRFKSASSAAGAEGGGFFKKAVAGFKGGIGGDKTKEMADKAKDVDKAGKTGQGIDSKKIRKFFQDLAAGLRSMGSMKVLAGIGNTILFAPAAVVMVAAIPFLSFIGGIKLPFLKSNLTGLGQGLTKLSSGIVGVVVLALAGPAMVASLLAIPFLTFMGLTPLVMLQTNLSSLGQGLLQLGIGLPGVLALGLLGPAGALAALSIPFLAFMAIPGVGVAISVGLGALGTGLATLGGVAATGLPFIAIGAIAALGVAMIPFALSLRLVTPLVEAFGNIIVNVLGALPPVIQAVADGIVTVFGGIGDLITKVVASLASLADPSIIAGLYLLSPALIALGFSFLPLAYGLGAFTLATLPLALMNDGNPFGIFLTLAEAAPGIETAAKALSTLGSSSVIDGLINLSPAIHQFADALNPLSLALVGFGLSTALLSLISGGKGPFGMFIQLSEAAPGIDMASSAIVKMAAALGELQNALDKVDSEKLSDVMNPSLGGVVLGLGTAAIQGATDAVTGVADSISGMFGGEGGDNDPVVEELRAVKEVLNQILTKEGNVQIDTSRAGTAFALGTSRLQ